MEKAFGLIVPDLRIVNVGSFLKPKPIKEKIKSSEESEIIHGKRATDILIEEGHAVAYFGGLQKKKSMPKHMAIEKDFPNEGKVTLPK